MPSFSVGDYDFSFNKEKNGSFGIDVSSDSTNNDAPPQPQTEGDDNNNGFSFGIQTPSKKTIKTVQGLVNDKKSKSSEHLPQASPHHTPPPPMPTGHPPMMQQQYTGVSVQPQYPGGVAIPVASPGVQSTVIVTQQMPDAQLGLQYRNERTFDPFFINHFFADAL